MIVDVDNKVVLITGASRGIGNHLAISLAQEGARVVINYNCHYSNAVKTLNQINQYNNDCMIIRADVTNEMDVKNMRDSVINRYGCIDVLINNAGVCIDGPAINMELDNWNEVINTNLTGTFICSKVFAENMFRNGGGKIINIASLKGYEISEKQVNYVSSKAAVIAMTKTIAAEFGAHGVSVNAICPGFICTDLNRHNKDKEDMAVCTSVMPIETSLKTLTDFIIYMVSDHFVNITGRVFKLDSRIRHCVMKGE